MDDTNNTTVESSEDTCGHTDAEQKARDIGFTAYGPFTLGDFLSRLQDGRADEQYARTVEAQQPRISSLPELQYRILSALRVYLSDSDVESGYFGTRYTLPLRNGQTAQITITVKDKE